MKDNKHAPEGEKSGGGASPSEEQPAELMKKALRGWANKAVAAYKRGEKVAKEYVEENKDDWLKAADAVAKTAADAKSGVERKVTTYVDDNKDEWSRTVTSVTETVVGSAEQALSSGITSAKENAKNMYVEAFYSKKLLRDYENRIEAQGALYREIQRGKSYKEYAFLGGERLATLMIAHAMPGEIEAAYAAQYPDLASEMSLRERFAMVDDEKELQGLVGGLKGKLFEQQYVEHLNAGELPDGYVAKLADSATQQGHDIEIYGPNGEIVKLLQAKATASVAYVKSAIDAHPTIDVVTTTETYSQLVMTGASESVIDSGVHLADLEAQIGSAEEAAEIDFDASLPAFTLAFIAFTSYKDSSLTLFQKASEFGDRAGRTYLSYLIGGAFAVATSSWWIGMLGSVGSRNLADSGMTKAKLVEKLKSTYVTNQTILDRMKATFSGAAPAT